MGRGECDEWNLMPTTCGTWSLTMPHLGTHLEKKSKEYWREYSVENLPGNLKDSLEPQRAPTQNMVEFIVIFHEFSLEIQLSSLFP